jgi:hypothetical protein
MLFKREYTRKAFSAILLVMLLFIHSIKLLHTHPVNILFTGHSCKNASLDINDNSENGNSSDCSICNYQLSKDADDLTYVSNNNDVTEQNIFNSRLISFHKFSFHITFENRGPPSIKA